MKTVTIFWIGTSKSGNHYVGVKFEEDGFFAKRFIECTADKAEALSVDQEISVSKSVLQ